ncbi:MAG: hypothetical protein HKN04_04450 [Rhodothermaceae bacterium]|nr:hypothetical protein [Rhodothermaceae bacterium]
MARRRPDRDTPIYLDTPTGIVTTAGTRFRTTEGLLHEFAGPVFAQEPLERLIRHAEAWLRGGVALALCVLLLGVLWVPAWLAGLLAVLTYTVWEGVAPSAPSVAGARLLRVVEHPLVQGVPYVIVLSLLGMAGRIDAVVVGLLGFVGFRLGAIQALLRPLLDPLRARLFPLPVPDQVLRAFIVRAALRHGVALTELTQLEQSARDAWRMGRK